MKRFQAACMAAIFSVALSGCATLGPITPTGDEVADCAAEAAKDIYFTLLPRVSTILATGPTFAGVAIELAKLVAEYGIEVVTCVVDAVRDRNNAAAAVATGDEKALHERSVSLATDWLAEHGAKIKQTQ